MENRNEPVSVPDLFDVFISRCIEAIRPIYREGETPVYGESYRHQLTEAVAVNVIDLHYFPVRYAYALHHMLEALQATRPSHEDDDIIDIAIEAAMQVCLDTLLDERDRDGGDRKARARFLREVVSYNAENGNLVYTVPLAERVYLDQQGV